ERETTGVVGKAERLTWHKAWTMVSTGFSISYTSSEHSLKKKYIYLIEREQKLQRNRGLSGNCGKTVGRCFSANGFST
ncbi:hypothetical protein ACRWUG_25070, partial [Escherichia coli]